MRMFEYPTHVKETQDIGYVYICTNPDFKTSFKIGYTTCVTARMKQLNVAVPQPMEVVLTLQTNDPVKLEHRLHLMFENKHIKGEYYQLTKEDFDKITSTFPDLVADYTPQGKGKKVQCKTGNLTDDIKSLFSWVGQYMPNKLLQKKLIRMGYDPDEVSVELTKMDDLSEVMFIPEENVWKLLK